MFNGAQDHDSKVLNHYAAEATSVGGGPAAKGFLTYDTKNLSEDLSAESSKLSSTVTLRK